MLGTEQKRTREEAHDARVEFFLNRIGEVDTCCSLICYYGAKMLNSVEGCLALIEAAKKVDRGFGMYVMAVFNKSWDGWNRKALEEAGFTKVAEYPAAHDPKDTVLIYGANTGQAPH